MVACLPRRRTPPAPRSLLFRFLVTAPRSPLFLFLVTGSLFGCGDAVAPGPPGIDDALPPTGNAVLGEAAFVVDCASCHATRDAFDLAFFGFPDTTIVRRAVAHVDTATALDIVAHVRSLPVRPTSREERPFQPADRRVGSDLQFALELFGEDGWPAEVSAAELRAIDPRGVRVALDFPLWSHELTNLDWMPEQPLAGGLLDFEGGAARALLERYYATRSLGNLLHAVQALRIADRHPENSAAPCVMEPIERFRPLDCFETRRWISTLAAQQMLREGIDESVHPVLHDAWWDVGNAARRALQRDEPFDNALFNWAVWMYLGWSFEPERHASIYLGLGLERIGLSRHATFVALRSAVARRERSIAPFHDVRNAAHFAPVTWAFEATRFGYEHLLERLDAGFAGKTAAADGEATAVARESVELAWILAARKVTHDEAAVLASLRDEILSRLP